MPSFLPFPSVMPSTFPFPLFYTPAFSPFSLPPLLNMGSWIQPQKNVDNLNVRTYILMCIVYVENSH